MCMYQIPRLTIEGNSFIKQNIFRGISIHKKNQDSNVYFVSKVISSTATTTYGVCATKITWCPIIFIAHL